MPILADQGQYIASEASFYRVLREADQLYHRGQAKAPTKWHKSTAYCATQPNAAWSWDITWLSSVIRGQFFYLYMVMDIYSRKIVGWEGHDTNAPSTPPR